MHTTSNSKRFNFEIEFECFQKAGPDGKERRFGGICTTDKLDRQQERVLADGLDFGPFLKGGWFNDNHDTATDAVVGYPTHAELRELPDGSKGWYVEGYMLKGDGNTRADKIWELANALQKTDRRLGFSVEGAVLDRDPTSPGIVRKAVVQEVAITKCPVAHGTALGILAKSLDVGAAVNPPAAAEPGDGFALRSESLESDEDKKKKRKKKMSKAEAIAFLQERRPDLSTHKAEMIVNYALRHHPA